MLGKGRDRMPDATAGPGPGGAELAELSALGERVGTSLGFLDVSIGGRDAALPFSCAELIQAQDSGVDATADWRHTVRLSHTEYYGVAAPERVAAAFVLQWYLGVVANPLAGGAVLGEWVLDASPEVIRFDRSDEAGYPDAVALSVGHAYREPDADRRMQAAGERYLDHAHRFVHGYRPPVKMSSRQRTGMVSDVWTMAVEAFRSALGQPGQPGWRQSCCFIFALPGATECSRCPRRRPASAR